MSNKRRAGLSVHVSGLAVILVILAILRWGINRLYLNRAKNGLFG